MTLFSSDRNLIFQHAFLPYLCVTLNGQTLITQFYKLRQRSLTQRQKLKINSAPSRRFIGQVRWNSISARHNTMLFSNFKILFLFSASDLCLFPIPVPGESAGPIRSLYRLTDGAAVIAAAGILRGPAGRTKRPPNNAIFIYLGNFWPVIMDSLVITESPQVAGYRDFTRTCNE